MVFSSILFLVFFFPLVTLIYFFTPTRFKNYWLLFSSLIFYAWGGSTFFIILVGTTVVDFYLVNKMDRTPKPGLKKLLLTISVFITIGLLAYYKYANFFVDNVNALLHIFGFTQVKWTSVLLPIGISFFSFQKLTYAVDVYRKVHAPLSSATNYLLYIVFFPQLIAGPIIRFNEIADQIEQRHHIIDNVYAGLVRFIIGLAKKVLIANTLSRYADGVFDHNLMDIDSFQAWLALLCYTFQIYFDFAGYSDMAIGMGRMFGFQFPENFNNPYISANITEFWRRWHITLGRWMKDYLYIPLGGNRVKSNHRLYFNLMAVFLISGLWHGASWNFVAWGLFHGLFLVFDRLFLIKLLQKTGKIIPVILTFFLTMMGWVLFKIENFSDIGIFVTKLFSFNFNPIILADKPDIIITLVLAFIFSGITLTTWGKTVETNVFFAPYTTKTALVMFVVAALLLILSVGNLTASNFNPFIYFRF